MDILETKHLTKHFGGVHAVEKVSIMIKKGYITALIGPNGSGKTTLINLLSGMLTPDAGEILIDGVSLSLSKPYEVAFYGITRTFQGVRLFEQMSVLDNILVVVTERSALPSLFEKHTKYHLEKAKEVLEEVGLWEKRNELVLHLSYGQRKLIEIARVLAMNTEIILLDEPFAGLFPEMRKVVFAILERVKKSGKAIVIIEHDMDLITRLCDYIFVMDSGELIAEGEPKKTLKQRKVIEAYLGE